MKFNYHSYFWSLGFSYTQRLAEIGVNSIVGLAFAFWRFDPGSDNRFLLLPVKMAFIKQ